MKKINSLLRNKVLSKNNSTYELMPFHRRSMVGGRSSQFFSYCEMWEIELIAIFTAFSHTNPLIISTKFKFKIKILALRTAGK